MADKVKFYTDENVNPAVARGLHQRGVDTLTARDAGMLNAKDEEQLKFASSQERVTVTHDDDFLRLHKAGLRHSGIAYAPHTAPIGAIIRGLMLIYDVLAPEEMHNHVEFL